MWDAFKTNYLPEAPRYRLRSHELHTSNQDGRSVTKVTAQVEIDGEPTTVTGTGDGPIEAFVNGLRSLDAGSSFDVLDYNEHAMGRGADATAVAYVESQFARPGTEPTTCWGIG
ncbi:alpha-isopropylmalate synthase regulatory domain-containing protein, partial [Arthrospira platensis SPKY2]